MLPPAHHLFDCAAGVARSVFCIFKNRINIPILAIALPFSSAPFKIISQLRSSSVRVRSRRLPCVCLIVRSSAAPSCTVLASLALKFRIHRVVCFHTSNHSSTGGSSGPCVFIGGHHLRSYLHLFRQSVDSNQVFIKQCG